MKLSSPSPSLPLLCIVVACLLAGNQRNARAATITVTSTADSGPGTLRDALASVADGDTIDASGVSGTIALTSGELLVTNSVDILGPGPANLAVDGNFPNTTNRVFHIAQSNIVTIASLTITNGASVFTDLGTGILNDHSTLTVSNCTLSGNSAHNGGGIYNDGAFGGSATLTVIASALSGNSAGEGGGIFNDGAGGGSATLTVNNSTLSGNVANFDGGGIVNDGAGGGSATLAVNNSTLSGNTGGHGGGIYNNGGFSGSATLTVNSSTLSTNSAGEGGRHLQRHFQRQRDADRQQQHPERQLGHFRRRHLQHR